MTEAVKGGALLGIAQDLVSLRGLLEAVLSIGRIVVVRVQLARQPTERLLDLGVVGIARNAEHLIRIAWHAPQ